MSKDNKTQPTFAFGKGNYMLMALGMLVIVIGFVLMAGGGSDDPTKFSDEIFSTRRITVAPIVVLLGYAIEIAAILYRSKE